MTTMLRLNLFDIHPFDSHNRFVQLPFHAHKQFVKSPFHSRIAFSSFAITRAQSQSLFAQFASTKLNMSETDITRILRLNPHLQKLRTLHNAEQFIHILTKHGFTDAQIAIVMKTRPRFISRNVEKLLEAKICLLEDFGFQGRSLTTLLTLQPNILCLSLEKSLLPKLIFLKSIFEPEDVLVKATLREPKLLLWSLDKILKPSLAFWEGYGLSRAEIPKFLLLAPRVLFRTSLTPAEDVLIKNIGLDKGSKLFKYILVAVCVSRMETLEGRIEALKCWGLSAEQIWHILRVAPRVLYVSKETISKNMNFVVNQLEAPASSVVKYPYLLQNSLEWFMRPRFLVWREIKSTTGLSLSIFSVLRMSEARFIKFIDEHPCYETLWKIYDSAVSDAPNDRKRSSRLYSKRQASETTENLFI